MLLHPRFLLLCLLVGASAAPAARSQAIDATAFSLATLDATARGAGLAGAVSASSFSDAGAWFYNPALLAPETAGRLSFGMSNHPSALRSGTLAYARSMRGLGTGAAGLRFLGWGEIPRTDATGASDGTFRPTEFVATVALSRELRPNLRVAAAVHGMRNAIDGHAASAISMDAGVLLHRDDRGFALGASVHQLGLVLSSLGARRDALPFDVRVGVSKKLSHMPLLLTATAYGFVRSSDDGSSSGGALAQAFRHMLLGAEFQFSDAFQLRLGYDHRRHEALKIKNRLDFAGVSFGAGIHVRGFRIDYARTSWSSLGAVHRFGFSTAL